MTTLALPRLSFSSRSTITWSTTSSDAGGSPSKRTRVDLTARFTTREHVRKTAHSVTKWEGGELILRLGTPPILPAEGRNQSTHQRMDKRNRETQREHESRGRFAAGLRMAPVDPATSETPREKCLHTRFVFPCDCCLQLSRRTRNTSTRSQRRHGAFFAGSFGRVGARSVWRSRRFRSVHTCRSSLCVQ